MNFSAQPNVNNSSMVLAAQPSEMGRRNSISSIEIAEEAGRNHKDVMRSIREMESAWEKVNGRKFALVDYIDKKGESRPCYQFNYEEFMYVISKFDDVTRAKLVTRWAKLETGQASPIYHQQTQQQPTYSLEDKFKAIELSCKLLRKSKASKARMVNAVIVPMGLPAFDYIESEGQFLSAKDLLEMHPVVYKGKKLASITFNKILIEKGYMEVAVQPKGKTDLKLLTDKGLKWGRNDDSPEHPGSIIAHYNVKKFPVFLQELNLI